MKTTGKNYWAHSRIARRNRTITRLARLAHLEFIAKDDAIWLGFCEHSPVR